MKAVIQRVSRASVTVDGELISEIKKGYMILLGVMDDDTREDAEILAKKTISSVDGMQNLTSLVLL